LILRLMSLETMMTVRSRRILQGLGGAQDMVVEVAARQRFREIEVQGYGLEEQAPLGLDHLGFVSLGKGHDGQSSVDFLLVGTAHESIEKTADLGHIPRHFRHPFFALVEFLDHRHGQINIVLVEMEQGGGIVHQHVGIEDEEAGSVAIAFDHICPFRLTVPHELHPSTAEQR